MHLKFVGIWLSCAYRTLAGGVVARVRADGAVDRELACAIHAQCVPRRGSLTTAEHDAVSRLRRENYRLRLGRENSQIPARTFYPVGRATLTAVGSVGCEHSTRRAPYGLPPLIARDISRNALVVARLADGIDGRLLRTCRVCWGGRVNAGMVSACNAPG